METGRVNAMTPHDHNWGFDSAFPRANTRGVFGRTEWLFDFRFRCFDCNSDYRWTARQTKRWTPENVRTEIFIKHAQLSPTKAKAGAFNARDN